MLVSAFPPTLLLPSRNRLVRLLAIGLVAAALSSTARAAEDTAPLSMPALPKMSVEQPAVHHAHRRSLQTIDTTSLQAPVAPSHDPVAHALVDHDLVIEAHATTLRPAPLPDQDFDAPGPDRAALAAQQESSLVPSVYNHAETFSGDGFATGSNLEADKNNRRRPGGGMALSIPVP